MCLETRQQFCGEQGQYSTNGDMKKVVEIRIQSKTHNIPLEDIQGLYCQQTWKAMKFSGVYRFELIRIKSDGNGHGLSWNQNVEKSWLNSDDKTWLLRIFFFNQREQYLFTITDSKILEEEKSNKKNNHSQKCSPIISYGL